VLLVSHCRDLRAELDRFRPKVIGLSATTGAHEELLDLARFIKKHTDIQVVMGGPHATYYTDELCQEEGLDFICRGEGEEAMLLLVEALDSGGDTTVIPGIWAKTSSGWAKNDLGPLVDNLDKRPIPKREIYYKYSFLRDMPLKRFITGIGCPYPCTFCHSILLKREYRGKGKFMRRKSVSRVLEEIHYVRQRAHLANIHFSDDTFTLNNDWLREFAERYPREIGLPFSCNARLDVSHEAVDLLGRSGCHGVQLGFESGSPRIRQEYLRKKWSNENALEVVNHFRKLGIKTLATNMVGLPGETMEDVVQTVLWNARIGFDYARCNLFMPFPKLDLTKLAKEQGLLEKSFSLADYSPDALKPVFNTKHTNELINITNLFYPLVKLGWLRPVILKWLISREPNSFFEFIGRLNLFQEYFFFRMRPFSAFRYFKNTIGRFRGFRYGAWPSNRITEYAKAKSGAES